ncbi:MAG: hypothetical protein V4662_24995 [Verrucomicrobiota bacterium]
MSNEQIQEIKKAHPGPFAQKRAAGLTDEQAATVILSQIEHDAKHTPASIALAVAVAACELLKLTYHRTVSAFREAQAACAKAKEEDPDAQLPELLALEDPEVQDKLKQAQNSIDSLTATLGLRGERCRQLEAELTEALAGIASLRAERDTAADRIAELETAVTLKGTRILDLEGQLNTAINTRLESVAAAEAAQLARITQLEADLKTSQEALKKAEATPAPASRKK